MNFRGNGGDFALQGDFAEGRDRAAARQSTHGVGDERSVLIEVSVGEYSLWPYKYYFSGERAQNCIERNYDCEQRDISAFHS